MSTLRLFLMYILLSVMVVVFAKFFHVIIVYIDMIYHYINLKLSGVLSHSAFGVTLRKVILLVAIPLLIAAIPALCYKLIKGADMPYFLELTWGLWLVIVLSNVLI